MVVEPRLTLPPDRPEAQNGSLFDVPSPTRAPRVDAVDLLRGLAALGVAVFHIYSQYSSAEWRESLPALAHWLAMAGRWGVQLFFIISGFVIALTLFDRPRFDRPVDVGLYFSRRIVRLDLVYLFALALYLLASLGRNNCGEDAIAQLLPCPQWQLEEAAKNIFYFVPLNGDFWIPVAWTLVIEVHFYLFIATCFVFANRFRLQSHIPAFICLMTLLSLAFPAGFLGRSDADWIAPCLFNLLGGCLAFMLMYRRSTIVLVSAVLYAAGLLGVYWIRGESYVFATFLSWFLVIAVLACYRFFPAVPALLTLGKYSYGIYIFHLLIGFYFVQPLTQSSIPILSWGPIPLCLGLLATVALSAFSYHLVEVRSISWSKRIGR